MNEAELIVSNLMLELRRGTLILSVLSQLSISQYGYSLIHCLGEKGVSIEAGTLYPLLRRLEKQNLLESKWEITDTRPRRYYVLSKTGIDVYKKLCEEWTLMVDRMSKII